MPHRNQMQMITLCRQTDIGQLHISLLNANIRRDTRHAKDRQRLLSPDKDVFM